LENRTSELEMLYVSAQTEIKSLKDKIASSGIDNFYYDDNDASQFEFSDNIENLPAKII
jgi:hypothetical protein